MRWESYTKNSDVSEEKWELINEVLELLNPPKRLYTLMKQKLKKWDISELNEKIRQLTIHP